jgi:autophagy-related protein 17
MKRADALDAVLDSLGKQLVPPDFHQASSDSSLFGSQHSGDEPAQDASHSGQLQRSPTLTVRDGRTSRKDAEVSDRKTWKTLRDFVDERAIEDVLETIENDRNILDVGL